MEDDEANEAIFDSHAGHGDADGLRGRHRAGGADGDAHGNPDGNAYANGNTYADPDGYPDPEPDAHAEPDAYAYADPHP